MLYIDFKRITTSLSLHMSTEIQQHLDSITHPLKNEIIVLQTIICEHFPNLHEHIKWNALSYQINDDDFLTFNYSSAKEIRLIFHRGAKKKEQPSAKLIHDTSILLKWATNDRAIASFSSLEHIHNSKDNLIEITTKWMEKLL
jgi:hypothetical protein